MKYIFWVLCAISILSVSVMSFNMPDGKIPHFCENNLSILDSWIETESTYEISRFYLLIWGIPIFIAAMIFLFAHLIIHSLQPNHLDGPRLTPWFPWDMIANTLRQLFEGKGSADYWSRPESRLIFASLICSFLYQVGVISLLFYLFLVGDVLRTSTMEKPA